MQTHTLYILTHSFTHKHVNTNIPLSCQPYAEGASLSNAWSSFCRFWQGASESERELCSLCKWFLYYNFSLSLQISQGVNYLPAHTKNAILHTLLPRGTQISFWRAATLSPEPPRLSWHANHHKIKCKTLICILGPFSYQQLHKRHINQAGIRRHSKGLNLKGLANC
jgi:hypothetical protein